MRVYLAGPMRGHPDWNFPAFERAERKWRDLGHRVFSPASVAVALGYSLRPRFIYEGESPDTRRAQPTTEEGREHLQHVILSDIASLFASEAIVLLQGWEESRGATVELALAQFLGLLVFDAETAEQINPPARPWSEIKAVREAWKVTWRSEPVEKPPVSLVCSYCNTLLTSDDEAIPTASEKQWLLLCRKCYNEAGNTVR